MKKTIAMVMLFVACFSGILVVKAQEPTTNGGVPIGAKWCSKHKAYDICWKTGTPAPPKF